MPDSTTPPAAPAAPASPVVRPGPQEELNSAQSAQVLDWVKADISKGKITQAQAGVALNDLGTDAADRAPDNRSQKFKRWMHNSHRPSPKSIVSTTRCPEKIRR